MKTIFAAAFAALALAACAADKLSYKGQLAKPDGSTFNTSLPMTMTFRLYDVASGGKALWGRTMPVRMSSDGSFYVELADDSGSAVSDAKYANLADALLSASGFWIGLTPGNYTEMLPRQPLASMPRALKARYARHVGTMKSYDVEADTLNISSAPGVREMTVKKTIRQNGRNTTLSVSGSRNIYAAKELKLTDGISGIRTRAYSSTSLSTAPTDLFAIWHDASEVEGSGYCSLIVPSGATLRKCNGGGTSYVTTFGRGL